MGAKLPRALAGNDNEVSADKDGMVTAGQYVAGVVAAMGIIGVGTMIYDRISSEVGAVENPVEDLY